MTNKPRIPRIIRETVKDMHTSHWDLDMLSHAELDALLGADNNARHGADDDTESAIVADPGTDDEHAAKTSNSAENSGSA